MGMDTNDPDHGRKPKRRLLRRFVMALAISVAGLTVFDLLTADVNGGVTSMVLRPLAIRTERLAKPALPQRLAENGFAKGGPVFIRIFKQSSELEIWMKDAAGWRLFDTWPVCRWSGTLGPKLKEGDGQSPEGFYTVAKGALNPNSNYHLSFNLGFPNAYDKSHGRTGSFLMVHGNCVSIGCYAMTDAGIEDIYGLVEAALENGQNEVPVHIFPFRMTAEAMAASADSAWIAYWRNLKEGHDLFETRRAPPVAAACGKTYVFATDGKPQCEQDNG